jgi:hypothetical protein
MKIYDIISEDTVQEGAVDLLKLAGRGLASGAKYIAQTGSRRDLVSMMSQNSQIIRNTLRGTQPTVAQIEATYGPRAAEIYSKDPNFMAKVLKQFHADRLARRGAPPPGSPPGTPPVPPVPPVLPGGTSLISKIPVTGLVAKAISVYGIYDMVQDYNKGIEYFDEQLKNGMSKEKYDAGVAHLKSTLVFQIAAFGPIFSIVKHLSGWTALGAMLRGSGSSFAQKLGANMGSMSAVARAALISSLNTKEARELWSDMFIGGTLDNIGKMTYDGVTGLFNSAKAKAKEKITGEPADTASDTAAPAEKDATSTAEPVTPASTNTSPYKSEVPSTSTYKGNPMFKGIN